MNLPKVSIITIVYNDLAHIIETMDSVLEQDYPHIEYIIIDGASTDGTKQAILAYILERIQLQIREEDEQRLYLEGQIPTQTTQKTFCFKFLSQKDSGIYDAMNKGIDLAGGEWCNFMNSGDRFYSSDSISKLFVSFLESHGGGARYNFPAQDFNTTPPYLPFIVIYGDTQLRYDSSHTKILYAGTNHTYHHRFIHQSAFISTPLMRHYRYDTSFQIAGDTDFFTKAYNNGAQFIYLPIVVASFNIEGVSSNLSWRMFYEDCLIGYKYNALFPLYHTFKYIFYVIPRICVRKILPSTFRNRARIFFSKKYS